MVDKPTEHFDALVRSHLEDAYRLALRLCGDAHRAEDVTQEAFRRATQGWRKFEGRSEFKTWLFRIVVNVARSQKPSLNASQPLTIEPPCTAPGPDCQLESREFGEYVGRLIDALPPRQREVLVLRLHQECSPAEIARIAGVSEQNVRTNLHLARRRLQQLLRPFLEGDNP